MRRPAILLFLIGISTTIHAVDWPQWRGPSATGISPETGLPVQWNDTQGIAWRTPIRGLGISSPIVSGDRVFVTSQIGSGESRPGPRLSQQGDAGAAGEVALGRGAASATSGAVFLVSSLDRANGRKVWEYELPAEGALPSVHEKHNLATSSPVTDGRRVYAWFGTGQLIALDLSGKPVWTRNLGADYGPFQINWGHASSPIVHGDMVILLCYHERTSYLLAVDARTGANRWKADRAAGTLSYSTPFVVDTAAGTSELIVNSSVGISGHNPRTGEMVWHFQEDNRFPIPMPVQHNGVIYTSRGYRSSPFMAIRTGGKGDVDGSHVMWRVPSGGPYVSSIVYYDGLIYMMGDVGVLTVTDASNGERVFQERLGGVYSASPVAADGKIYLLGENGETIVLSAGRTPRVLARNTLTARQLASPAISGGRLFIRSDNAVYAIAN